MNRSEQLLGKRILITGSARRIGRQLALSCAQAGADIIIHHSHSSDDAKEVQSLIQSMGRNAQIIQKDLADLENIKTIIEEAAADGPLYALVNNAAIFENLDIKSTTLENWQQHLTINLTAPFLLSQAFATRMPYDQSGRIVNILDWRALRPGADHLPYTISKSALVALTLSLAQALAPRIMVNGLALGAILKPADGTPAEKVIQYTPVARWANLEEVGEALIFLLSGPTYITGEILHLDGGRHLI